MRRPRIASICLQVLLLASAAKINYPLDRETLEWICPKLATQDKVELAKSQDKVRNMYTKEIADTLMDGEVCIATLRRLAELKEGRCGSGKFVTLTDDDECACAPGYVDRDPDPNVLECDGHYYLMKGFLTDELVDYYLKVGDNKQMQPSKNGDVVKTSKKRRTDGFYTEEEAVPFEDLLYSRGRQIIQEKLGVLIAWNDGLKICHYDAVDSGFYIAHTDSFHFPWRNISFVVSLTSDYEGGMFHFPTIDKSFKLEKGDAIFFRPELKHGVTPVTKGHRKVLVSFCSDEQGLKVREEYKGKRTRNRSKNRNGNGNTNGNNGNNNGSERSKSSKIDQDEHAQSKNEL